MDSVIASLSNTHLDATPRESEQLLFRPEADSGLDVRALDNIPRYLIRVASPCSDGETDKSWVRSKAAVQKLNSSLEDIFSQLDDRKRTTIAHTLNLHLRWWPEAGFDDNFMSWTSSFLFTIRYIYYRHLSNKDGSSLDNIDLYIIDTRQFHKGTFLCDLDLIDAFYQFDYTSYRDLKNLRTLRNRPEYYFGEYLSQGSLKIEGKCQVIPARVLFENDRLRRIQPYFEPLGAASSMDKPEWAKEVRRFRQAIWQDLPVSSGNIADCVQAIGEIIVTLAPRWRLPLAIYLAGLIGPASGTKQQKIDRDRALLAFFRLGMDVDEKCGFQSLDMGVIAPETMPELKSVQLIVREIDKDWQLRCALEFAEAAEYFMQNLQKKNSCLEEEESFSVDDSNEVMARDGQMLLSKLRNIRRICDEIEVAMS